MNRKKDSARDIVLGILKDIEKRSDSVNSDPAIAASNRAGLANCGLPIWGESSFGGGPDSIRVHSCPFVVNRIVPAKSAYLQT